MYEKGIKNAQINGGWVTKLGRESGVNEGKGRGKKHLSFGVIPMSIRLKKLRPTLLLDYGNVKKHDIVSALQF